MKQIYMFSGLGADERVFKYLDFSDYKITHIHWILPNKNEKIENYAKRLTEQIKSENPILIGLSFGGIMANEVAKLIKTEKIIIIASAKTQAEIPFYFRWAGYLKIHKLLPTKLMKKSNFFTDWLFGVQNKNDKKLLKDILEDTNEFFLEWAIDKIVNWKNYTKHQNLRHIHGTADKILPAFFVNCDLKIEGGGIL